MLTQSQSSLALPRSDTVASSVLWRPRVLVTLLIVAGLLLRFVVSALVGLEVDGTYSTVMARHVSLSYFDHPPMHYWLVAAAVHLFGSEASIIVRLPFILMFAGSTWLIFKLTEKMHSTAAGLWAALALNLCGAFTFAYSWFVVPDGPLFFFLLLAAYLLSHAVSETIVEPPRTLFWIGAGAAGGAAMLSKYMAVFFFAGAFLFVLTRPRLHRVLLTRGSWLGIGAALVVFSPVLIWNAQHEWASFVFQGVRALPDNGSWHHFFGSMIGQLGYLVPWFGLWMAYVLVKSAHRGPSEERRWFFVCLAIGPITAFTAVNLLQEGDPHWTMPGWLMVLPLLGIEVAEMGVSARKWMRVMTALGLVTVVVMFAGIVAQVRTGTVVAAISRIVPVAKLNRREPSTDLLDWTPLRTELERRGLTKDVAFVGGLFTLATTKVGYAFGPDIPLLCLCGPTEMHHFAFIQDEAPFAGKDGLIIVGQAEEADVRAAIARNFDRIEQPVHLAVLRGGTPALQFSVFRGVGFRPFRHF